MAEKFPAREAKRLQTRERLMGAAIAEFRREGMDAADIGAIVKAAGVAHGTFYFHFPTKEHVMLDLEQREEERMSRRFVEFTASRPGLEAVLGEALHLVLDLEERLGTVLFRDFLVLHFSPSRPASQDVESHRMIELLAEQIARARARGDVGDDVVPMNSAVFFLLGLYALLSATRDWPARPQLLDDFVTKTARSMQSPTSRA